MGAAALGRTRAKPVGRTQAVIRECRAPGGRAAQESAVALVERNSGRGAALLVEGGVMKSGLIGVMAALLAAGWFACELRADDGALRKELQTQYTEIAKALREKDLPALI